MPKVKADDQGKLVLPESFLQRRHISPHTEYWLDEKEGDLILHPCLSDVRKLYIEPTTVCNLHCLTCIRNIWKDSESEMSAHTFNRLVESLDQLPDLKRVVFTGFGEPFTHPNILGMIETVRQHNLDVSLGSNGLLLTAEVARELVKLGVDRLVVSVDGVRQETYAGIRGAMLSQVLGNLRTLNEVKSQLNSLIPAVGIEFVVLRGNVAELAELTGLASRLNAARVLVSNVLCYNEELRSEILYGYEPQPPFNPGLWPVRTGPWVTLGTLELPRMHWGA